eukprot:TRINITY_DN2896_c0_g2_i1.p1 TRINITY_DN2896_c0_g2~~TRINITY_DN2896_c0_g2_i1.p1  ORF type:complete len:970 (+),score=269.25 TRINITY_DN2896_c0_g2_i1:137-3046(+)
MTNGSFATLFVSIAATQGDTVGSPTVEELGEADLGAQELLEWNATQQVSDSMENCMATATTTDEFDTCIYEDARDALEGSLGSGSVDNATLFDYIESSAQDNIAAAVESCVAGLGTTATEADLDACITSTGRTRLAISLGVSEDELQDWEVYEYLDTGASGYVSDAVVNCVVAASSDADRETCVTSTARTQLAAVLAVDETSLTDTDVREYLEAGVELLVMETVSACMSAVNTSESTELQAAARSQCRNSTACNRVAANLGLLQAQVSATECEKYLSAADERMVWSRMRSCIASVDNEAGTLSESEEREQRGLCKTNTARANLELMLGGDSVTSEELQGYIEASAQQGMARAMNACMQAISTSGTEAEQAANRSVCRSSVAKDTAAESYGALTADVSDWELVEILDRSSAYAFKQAGPACMAVASTDADREACQEVARTEAATTLGEASLDDFDFEAIQQESGLSYTLDVAKACIEANNMSECDLVGAFGDGAALVVTSTVVLRQQLSYRSADQLLKENLLACLNSLDDDGGTRSASDVEECAKAKASTTYTALDKDERKALKTRAMQRKLGYERMAACMSVDGANVSSCQAETKTYQQSVTAGTVSDEDVEDTLLLYRTELYNLVWDPTLTACNVSNKTSYDGCMETAANKSELSGGANISQKMEIGLNALRKAADKWCSCNDLDGEATECEALAKEAYVSLSGDEEDWEDAGYKDFASGLADAYCQGDLTQIVRTGVIEHVTEFAVSCAELDPRQLIAAIETAILDIDRHFTVEFPRSTAEQEQDDQTACSIVAHVEIGNTPFTMDTAVTLVSQISVSAQLLGRRSFISGLVYAAENTLECASTGCNSSSSTDHETLIAVSVFVILFLTAVLCCGGMGLSNFWMWLWRKYKTRNQKELDTSELQDLVTEKQAAQDCSQMPALEMVGQGGGCVVQMGQTESEDWKFAQVFDSGLQTLSPEEKAAMGMA